MEPAVAEQLNLGEEYRTLVAGVGILERLPAGILEVSGKNAVPFLNGLVTADLKLVEDARGALAAFLNVQGKVLALARIYRRSGALILELDGSSLEKIHRNLSRFVPAGEFNVRDITSQIGLVSLQGPRATSALEPFLKSTINDEPYSTAVALINGTEALVARHARTGTVGFDLFIPAGDVGPVVRKLSDIAEDFGGRQVSPAAVDLARIDAGIPIESNEVNEEHILLETGLDDAVSYTKGCYLGQEIIARIHWRGQPARRVRKLAIQAATLPPPGAELWANDGKRIGELTSSATVPATEGPRMVALGYVHRYYLNIGTRFAVRVNGEDIGLAEIV